MSPNGVEWYALVSVKLVWRIQLCLTLNPPRRLDSILYLITPISSLLSSGVSDIQAWFRLGKRVEHEANTAN